MRYPKLRELVEAIKALIVGPYTAYFPKKPAICSSKYRGRPVYDETTCIGCGACAISCPTGAITMIEAETEDEPYRIFNQDLGKCIFCGECQIQCPVETGIVLQPEWDLATLKREDLIYEGIRKEVLFCSDCGCVVGPIDQLRYLYKRLGPLAFSNPTLILSMEDDVSKMKMKKSDKSKHQDVFNVLCPRCRHKIFVDDTWGIT